jgi:hypothetical protein
MRQSDYSVNCFFDGGSNKSFNDLRNVAHQFTIDSPSLLEDVLSRQYSDLWLDVHDSCLIHYLVLLSD